MYVYKKRDKEKKFPIELGDAVRYKSLWNKALKIEEVLRNHFMDNNLMFEYEDVKTRQHLYTAIDELKRFRENLKLKSTIQEGAN